MPSLRFELCYISSNLYSYNRSSILQY
jgi:hypothetical protein